ncbi:hypothetical protein ACFQZ4_46790 [Catellatospora coxensis]|uniref:Uncharacterized protein n=2 Tax=Catellatospora coxensis TaxID=310354 RepID=A0A8J3P7L2_9ACTN|nr:hypothetical protein Cco03nite_31980 [Catellatospora coxensis]
MAMTDEEFFGLQRDVEVLILKKIKTALDDERYSPEHLEALANAFAIVHSEKPADIGRG